MKIDAKEVFKYFNEICKIPHGSFNMDKISEYCVNFAKENKLKYVCDQVKNVIIYKEATAGYASQTPVILQAHIDMVCQKTPDCNINFETDGLDVVIDGDFIKANGTTLGADNGIAVAMIMAILASNDISHPAIEAVFTTNEEVGMLGAGALDVSLLKGKRMINLDSEEQDVITVSCAGGSDFIIYVSKKTTLVKGTKITVNIKGLKGGHSGVEIDKGRVNANTLTARFLNHLKDYYLIDINGGDKANAIPVSNIFTVVADNSGHFVNDITEYAKIVKEEISDREPDFEIDVSVQEHDEFEVFDKGTFDTIKYMLLTTPNGIVDMSKAIPNLVETSLNLGILCTEKNHILMQYALRSNKKTALDFLEERMVEFANHNCCKWEKSGRYQPWEYNKHSELRDLYKKVYKEKFKTEPKIEAIHAGLECAVFSSSIKDLDCIAIGPTMFGVHTTEEKLSISSTRIIFELLCKVLEKLC
ncbi:MAG: aminoacyl-histidine dipeptidase [Clostridia bacterium]|nr:aminoacyl-histidine dipeptidase [Clostridia bacterium]